MALLVASDASEPVKGGHCSRRLATTTTRPVATSAAPAGIDRHPLPIHRPYRNGTSTNR